jgi:uroporphyrin-III C-methyltransferase
MSRSIPPVVLAGAGPGDPGLLTVAALTAIREAEVLVVDRLVSREIVDERWSEAKLVYVGKAPGRHAVPQEMISELLIAQARTGRRVVRLKGGDPFIYGRGGEEALALRQAGIPFRVIPGVSSVFAVPAYAGIPLTHRGVATRFTVVAGSRAELGAVPEESWKSLASGDATLVVVMGFENLSRIVEKLLSHGVSSARAAAAISQGTTSGQIVARSGLSGIVDAVAEKGMANPMVLVVGDVAALHDSLDWFDAAESPASTLGDWRESVSGSGAAGGEGAERVRAGEVERGTCRDLERTRVWSAGSPSAANGGGS